MNPRYEVYARAHRRTPEEMAAQGWAYCEAGNGFSAWLSGQWREWAALNGIPASHTYYRNHAAFDAWLQEKYPIKNNS